MDSSPTDSTPAREDSDALFKEMQGILDKLLKFLVPIIAFKLTETGQHFFKTHTFLMIALVLQIMLYFSTWLLATAPQPQIMRTFLPLLTCLVLTIGVILSVWALIVFL